METMAMAWMWTGGGLPKVERRCKRGWQQTTRGQGLVEYALILVLVAVVVIGSVTLVGQRTSQVFDQVNCTFSGGKWHQDNGNGNSNKCK